MMSRWSFIRLVSLSILTVWTGTGCDRLDNIAPPDRDPSLSLVLSLKNVLPGQETPTKLSPQVTQSEGVFRGIEHVYLVPFNTKESRAVEPEDPRLGTQNIVLGSSAINKSGLVANNNSHLFGSAIVPSRMNRILAYGKAPDNGSLDTKDNRHANGMLTQEGLDNPANTEDISFHLESILASGETNEYDAMIATADELLDQLNVVMTMMAESPFASIVSIFDNVKRENQILSCSYASFDQLRTEIQTALLRIPFESMDLIQEISRVSQAVSAFSQVLMAIGRNFPASYGIPEGAIGFWWNGKAFIRLINGVNIALVEPASYCYPPSLWYFANSPVKTSNNENVKNQYIPTHEHWENILAYYGDGDEVTSITQGVAIVDPLQYGVGLLELSLSAPGAEAATLINNCPLTGIIVGDQKDVDYRFMPGSGPSRYIYDNVTLTSTGYPMIGKTGQTVPTLVLQTLKDTPIHFALEFKNTTGYTRHCQQGDILPQCKFYLVGKLEAPVGGSVFTQDHKTTVSVKIESLRSAYNTIPDLHDPQLEIGIVTEMKWNQITPQSIILDF